MHVRSVGISHAAVAAALLVATTPGAAQEAPLEPVPGAGASEPEAVIIVTGTRRVDRTVIESATPVDVFTNADLVRQGTSDTTQLLQAIVPSFTVARQAISDGTTFVRPPNLRGLAPDQTLVLVNGKRRHRSALVQVGAGALAQGSQAADLAQIPAIAIERIEVLRDGASSQYGSDAIAGVINIGLRNDREGVTGWARYGQFYEGDGEDYQAALNVGLPLGPDGYINISGEYVNSKPTSRGVTRPSALALQQLRPDLDVRDPAQRWGNPDIEAARLFVNGGFDVGDGEIYYFGNYGHSFAEESFNYRQPIPVSVTGTDGAPQTINQAGVFNDIYLDRLPNGNYDAEGRTFTFRSIYPAGFTPFFYGKIDDISGAVGYRGTTGFGLRYDVSAYYGQDTLEYFLHETLNASLGPDSSLRVSPGALEQRESTFNLDLSYPLDLGLASDLNVAGGFEYRREAYEIKLGDSDSYVLGPYGRQVVERDDGTTFVVTQPSGSNGFPGYGPDIAGETSRKSYAIYVDLETDLFEGFTLGAGGRYEHFTDFDNTTTGKVFARYALTPAIAIRGTASTGFRAPSPGQVNTSSIATTFFSGNPNPVELATLPVSHPAAIYYGAVPLTPEEAVNFTGGVVVTPAPGLTLTVDYYNIEVKDRIGTSQTFEVSDADREALRLAGVENYASLGQVQYLTNAFSTRTQGVDVVGSWILQTGLGTFNTTLGANWNETEVTERDPTVISDNRVAIYERQLPKYRAILTEVWTYDALSLLVRGNYFSKFTDTDQDNGAQQTFGAEFTFDLELTYEINDTFSITAGAQNILDNYPDRDLRGGIYPSTGGQFTGLVYNDNSPFGFNGGFWYARLGVSF